MRRLRMVGAGMGCVMARAWTGAAHDAGAGKERRAAEPHLGHAAGCFGAPIWAAQKF